MNLIPHNSSSQSPLAGIKVIEHTSALAGPYCAQLLGDLGADVIKIEKPDGGDMSRGWGPPFINGESAYFLGTNRNKRGMTLDLSQLEGRDILHRLVKASDVLIQNIPRAGSRKKLGLDETTCRGINFRLIWASITGFGNTGPNAERPGYDIIAQAMSGTMSVTGEVGADPMRFPTAMADISGGIYTAMAILAALFARERTGEGQAIDTSLVDSQVTWLAYLASNYFATGDPVKKLGNAHPSIVPYQPFATADGWIMVAVGSEKLWQTFTDVIQKPELKQDSRFATNTDRIEHRAELLALLTERFNKQASKTWLDQFEAAGIPAGPIYTPDQALNDEHILSRNMIVQLEHPTAGNIKSLGNPIKLDKTPVSYRLPPPRLGEHTNQILVELGYDKEKIAQLQESKTI